MNPVHHTFPLSSYCHPSTCVFQVGFHLQVLWSKFWCFIFCPCIIHLLSMWTLIWSYLVKQTGCDYIQRTVRFIASFVPFGSKMLSSVQLMPVKTILSHSLWNSLPTVNPHYFLYITTANESYTLQQCHTFHSDINCVTHSAVYIVSRFLSVKPMKYNDSLCTFVYFIFPNIYESHTFQSYEYDGYISISCSFTKKKAHNVCIKFSVMYANAMAYWKYA